MVLMLLKMIPGGIDNEDNNVDNNCDDDDDNDDDCDDSDGDPHGGQATYLPTSTPS